MSDIYLNQFVQYGTAAERAAFTPSPPQLGGADVQVLYIWYEEDTALTYVWNGSAWVQIAGSLPVLSADPSSPANGTAWLLGSGVSPARTLALRVRDAGTTYTIASITV